MVHIMLTQYVPQRLRDSSWSMKRLKLALVSCVLFVTASFAGCAGGVEIRPLGQPGGPPPATRVESERAIAVLGVDYDPPVEGWTAGSLDEGVTLLVAVANQGRLPAENVSVTVSLLDPGAPPGAPVLGSETQVIKALAPGQVTQVRFAAISRLPERARYVLRVEARPLPGETEVTDNERAYDIRLQLDP